MTLRQLRGTADGKTARRSGAIDEAAAGSSAKEPTAILHGYIEYTSYGLVHRAFEMGAWLGLELKAAEGGKYDLSGALPLQPDHQGCHVSGGDAGDAAGLAQVQGTDRVQLFPCLQP